MVVIATRHFGRLVLAVGGPTQLRRATAQGAEVVAVGDLGDLARLPRLVDLDRELAHLPPEGLLARPHLARHPDEGPGEDAERIGALDHRG